MNLDLNLLPLFIAVAETRNFRAAADRLGITRSAASQGVRRLEDACKALLFTRTTRSVNLTEAGAQLLERLRQPLQEIAQGLEETRAAQSPSGQLRLAVTSIAEPFLSGPLLARFAEACPQIQLDVTVNDEEFDIVAAGFDAGVRLGEVIEQDMIAVPLGGEQRELAVASPAYIAAHGAPRHPRELIAHRCIGWRQSLHLAPHRWEFVEDGKPFDVQVQPQITTNDLNLMLRTALNDGGITFALEENLRPYLERGELVPLLQEYLPPFPGFFLYFPQRRHLPAKLRALIEHVRGGCDTATMLQ